MIKYKLQIQQKLKLQIMEVIFYKTGFLKCNNKNIIGKISNFIKSTKTSSPTADSIATNLPPIGDSFMYV